MKLELNTKEWLAIYGALERHANGDKHLTEIHNRMKATLAGSLNELENSRFNQWFAINTEKVKDLESQLDQITRAKIRPSQVLTDDDDEIKTPADEQRTMLANYPRSAQIRKHADGKRSRKR